ncbi:hypothetical protein [Paracoccus ravus]|uniref:hypothetical protein n=1 Tax=Paracoccus ravus TaxID=2447760 RepID=UPI00106EF153|nr:hypothetical protein [Paracoccus ravus]
MSAADGFSSDGLERLRRDLDQLAPRDRTRETGREASSDLLSPQALPDDPAHMAIIAVIDHAIPIAHRLLTLSSGHSRIASAWLMDAPRMVRRRDIPFGQEYRGAEIDKLRQIGSAAPLDEDSFYREIGLLDPEGPNRWLMRAASHGAGVTCTAAGYLPGDGTARQRPVLAVALPDWAIAATSGAAMPQLIQTALYFILSRARILSRQIAAAQGKKGLRPPLVINISMGVTAGPRDGHSPLERLLDEICNAKFPDLGQVHVVLASGNTRQQQLHAVLAQGKRIAWRLLPDDLTPSELQVWTSPLPPGSPAVKLALKLPGMAETQTAFHAPIQPGTQQARLRDANGQEIARLVLRAVERGAQLRQCLSIVVPATVVDRMDAPRTAAGTWHLRLVEGSPEPCDLVIQRDDSLIGFPRAGRQSRLIEKGYSARAQNGQWLGPDARPPDFKIRRDGTLNSYGWGGAQLRCGSAYRSLGGDPGYGSLLETGLGGDIDAPSDRGPALMGMLAPGNRGRAMQAIGGTSIAAPRLTRWLGDELARGTALPDRTAVIAAARAAGPARDVPCVAPPLPWRCD